MTNIIHRIRNDKKEYKMQMARVAALPEDYRYVFDKMQNYLWSFTSGDGFDMLQTQYDLIELFENGVAEGKHVLDVTGEDVAGFCEEAMRGNKLWMDNIRKRLNRKMQKKLQNNK